MTRSWCLRRVGTSGGSGDAADAGRTGELVGVGAAGGGAAAAGGAGAGGHAAGRPGVLRTVRAVLRPASGPAVDADGDLPADDVPEVPLPANRCATKDSAATSSGRSS